MWEKVLLLLAFVNRNELIVQSIKKNEIALKGGVASSAPVSAKQAS